MKLIIFVISIFLFLFNKVVISQTTFSIVTDLSAVRNQKQNQQFWTAGHTIKTEMHLTKKDGPYMWVSYFIPGKFKNKLVATAILPTTVPQSTAFTNKAEMKLKEISIGWKHYFKGGSDLTDNWSLYGMAGFGIIGGNVKNNFLSAVDTTLYTTPIINGSSRFKRLTADLGFGWELPVSGELALYNEITVWIPTSSYPSKYLLVNNAPLITSFHLGIRIYFD